MSMKPKARDVVVCSLLPVATQRGMVERVYWHEDSVEPVMHLLADVQFGDGSIQYGVRCDQLDPAGSYDGWPERFYDTVADEVIVLPNGWESHDTRNHDIVGPDGYVIQISGPHGRWVITRDGKAIRKGRYKSARAALENCGGGFVTVITDTEVRS